MYGLLLLPRSFGPSFGAVALPARSVPRSGQSTVLLDRVVRISGGLTDKAPLRIHMDDTEGSGEGSESKDEAGSESGSESKDEAGSESGSESEDEAGSGSGDAGPQTLSVVSRYPKVVENVNEPFDHVLPKTWFADPESGHSHWRIGDKIDFSFTLEHGDPLPEWLSFKQDFVDGANKLTMSGTCPKVQAIWLEVKATVPSESIAMETIQDPDGKPVAYAVSLMDGGQLPEWLHFDPETETLSGTPSAAQELHLLVEGKDEQGLTAQTSWKLKVGPSGPAPKAKAQPLVAQHLPLWEGTVGEKMVRQVPEGVVSDPLGSQPPRPPVRMSFDPKSMTFSGVPDKALSMTVYVKGATKDGETGREGLSARSRMKVVVGTPSVNKLAKEMTAVAEEDKLIVPTLPPPEYCTEMDVMYEPIDMNMSDAANGAKTVVDCMLQCRNMKTCAHFTFFFPLKQCHFSSSMATRQTGRIGFVAGGALCAPSQEHPESVEDEFDTQHCGVPGLTFTPLNPSGRTSSYKDDGLACQKECQSSSFCRSLEEPAIFRTTMPSPPGAIASSLVTLGRRTRGKTNTHVSPRDVAGNEEMAGPVFCDVDVKFKFTAVQRRADRISENTTVLKAALKAALVIAAGESDNEINFTVRVRTKRSQTDLYVYNLVKGEKGTFIDAIRDLTAKTADRMDLHLPRFYLTDQRRLTGLRGAVRRAESTGVQFSQGSSILMISLCCLGGLALESCLEEVGSVLATANRRSTGVLPPPRRDLAGDGPSSWAVRTRPMSEPAGQQVELSFQRASVHLVHDVKRLEDGEDLNDALLDFFVKLGQALIPNGTPGSGGASEVEGRAARGRVKKEAGAVNFNEGLSSVAYLGSYFYGMLQKGHASDGRQGHSNVANWAKRRLGKGGLFADEVGALAVPVNELLRDYMGRQQEKHWWLALLVNPRGACPKDGPVTEHVSVSCLDSFARTGMRYKPPRRALKMEKETRNEAYFVEVSVAEYKPPLKLELRREPNQSQQQAARLLGGYCGKECEIHAPADGQPYADEKESAHDCGFFILEQVLRLLQLTPTALRSLASKSTEERSENRGALTDERTGLDCWCRFSPTVVTKEVVKRKKKLREVTADLFVASRRQNTSDVEVLLKNDEILRKKLLLAMWEGPYFARAVANVIGMDPGPLPEIPTLPKEDRWSRGGPHEEERQAKEEESEESSSERSSSRARSSSSARESSSSSRGKKRKTRRSASRYPSKTLRNMCVQYKVLPIGMVERTDLLKALEPLAVVKSASSSCATARAVERPGNGVRSDLPSFTTADLDTMPISKLKMYCIQFGRKSDLKKALLPLAKVAPKPVTPAVVKKVLPSFTLEELQTMPISKLKNICLQYGRMPHGPVERTDLVSLLKPFATGMRSVASALGVPSAPLVGAASASGAGSATAAQTVGGSATPSSFSGLTWWKGKDR
eukprot:g24637.t1